MRGEGSASGWVGGRAGSGGQGAGAVPAAGADRLRAAVAAEDVGVRLPYGRTVCKKALRR